MTSKKLKKIFNERNDYYDHSKLLIRMQYSTIHDPIYHFSDDIKIDDCASDIMKTPEFIRLKGIKQAGITGLFTCRTYDRAEHSIGVYLLLKYLGATDEQCIGGLLHDIYHTNFSHTTDELFCGESQDSFHEKNKYLFFDKCCKNITKILTTYFPTRDVKYFLDGENMLVTKNKSFGADMLDYFIRDGFYEGVLSDEWVVELVKKIKLVNSRIILDDVNIARDFFNKTIYINDNVYMSPFSRGQYKIFMNILNLAITANIIDIDMLIYGYDSDINIYNRVKKHGGELIQELIELLETTTEYSYSGDGEKKWKKTNSKVTRKLRFLNPLCNGYNGTCGKPTQISEIYIDLDVILKEKQKQYSKQEELFMGTHMDVRTKI
jgi:uncharacterized protein